MDYIDRILQNHTIYKQFKYVANATIDNVGQTKQANIRIDNFDFLLNYIEISGFDQDGSFITNSPKDLITVNIQDKNTDGNITQGGIDIMHFSAQNQNKSFSFIPTILHGRSEFMIDFKHEQISQNGFGNAQLPIHLQIIFSGAKLHKRGS